MEFFSGQPSYRIYCKDDPNFALTVRDGSVVLAPSNPNDDYQHWYRDDRYGSMMRDTSNLPGFCLINKATNLAIMHPAESYQAVQLIPYDPNTPNASVMWTEVGEISDQGFRAIRNMNDTSLNFDAAGGHAGDGVQLICYIWSAGNNQYWNIEAHNDQSSNNYETVKIYCKAGPDFCLTVRNGMVVLAYSNPYDDCQHWYKDERYSEVKDAVGFPSFALINKSTNQAIRHSSAINQPVQLVSHDPNVFDESILWTADGNVGDGYSAIRIMNDTGLNLDAYEGHVRDGTSLVCYTWTAGDNQKWMIEPY